MCSDAIAAFDDLKSSYSYSEINSWQKAKRIYLTGWSIDLCEFMCSLYISALHEFKDEMHLVPYVSDEMLHQQKIESAKQQMLQAEARRKQRRQSE